MASVTSVERLPIRRGLQEGEARGRAKGREEGQVEFLARLLTKRFGPLSAEIHARLTQAPADQMERGASGSSTPKRAASRVRRAAR